MNTVFQKYAAALLPFAVLVVGASQTVLQDPTNWLNNLLFAIIVLGAVVTYIVKLIPDAAWQGRAKTGVAIVTTILTAVLPFVLPGGFDPAASLPVIIVAILNALSTELGVQIRADSTVLPAIVSTLPLDAVAASYSTPGFSSVRYGGLEPSFTPVNAAPPAPPASPAPTTAL